MPNKVSTFFYTSAGVILASALFWFSPVNAQAETRSAASDSTTNSSSTTHNNTFSSPNSTAKPGLLQRINERINQQYSQVKQQLENQIHSLTSDFSSGLNQLPAEIQSQVQVQIDKTIGALGIPDMLGAGRKIEEVISSTKADILHLDPRIQGKNARQDWNRTYTSSQAQSVLGTDGQKAMQQSQETAKQATDISASNADAAQSDLVTQDIMKKIALQNAQVTKVLGLVQGSLEQQNQIAATQNVNLNDIAQNLATEQRRKQNEVQANVNAIYRNAAFADGFWSSISGSSSK